MMPYIPGLRADIWARSSPKDRLTALSELENHLAEREGRQPCQVNSEDLGAGTRGVYSPQNATITLNENLLDESASTPYQAVETLFHESRHAYQHHVVENPELAKDKAQLEDWTISEKGGYIQPNKVEDYPIYRWQPTEMDANQVARERTDELYQETFQDNRQYPSYKAQKELEIEDDIEYAKGVLGENYIEAARQEMIEEYQRQQGLNSEPVAENGGGEEAIPKDEEETTLSEGDVQEARLGEEGESQEAELEEETASSVPEGEDYDYGYGYGY